MESIDTRDTHDVVVIGTGSAASSVATRCRAADWRVAVVDARPFGGTCALRGCDKKKVLVGAAELVDGGRRMTGKGVRSAEVRIDWAELMRFKRTFTDPVSENSERRFARAGIETFHGRARFVDGRAISEAAYKDGQQILNNWGAPADQIVGPRADLLNRYGIQAVVMNTFEYNTGGIYALAMALAKAPSSDWQLVYDDEQAMVFLRHPPAGTPVFSDRVQRVLDHLDTECTANIQHSPLAYLCARTMGDYWMRARDMPRARRMLQLYLEHALYKDPVAEEALRQMGGSGQR